MPNTEYVEERDGDLLIKASALNAAFSRYHQKYMLDKTSVMHYKGTKATTAALPESGNVVGDVWNVLSDGANYAWDGSNWDQLGTVVSLTGYATESYVDAAVAAQHDFARVTVGATNINAATASDAIEFEAGSNVTLTPDASNKKVTIAATDTTYSAAVASVSGAGGTDGLLTATDKEKLDGVATGAEVNQFAFKTITVGEGNEAVNVVADVKEDTFTIIAGSNVTLTGDATNDKLTIAATDTTYSAATPDTYSAGVKTADGTAGLMSSADKYKVDSLGTAANANTASSVTNGGSGLPTEDAVYDFVTGFGYQDSTAVSNAISTALGNALTTTQAQDMIDDIWNPPAESSGEGE